MGQFMLYTTEVGPSMANAARELAMHMIHPGPEHWKSLGHLIGCLKGKSKKFVIIRNPKVIKAIIFCDYNYAMDK